MSVPAPRVLAVTNMYPTRGDAAYGAFVAVQMDWVARTGAGVEVEFIDGRNDWTQYVVGAARVRRRVLSEHFDLVHAHYGLTGSIAALQPLPLVVSFCGDDLLGTPNLRGGITLKSRLLRTLSRWAAQRADAIVCKSEELRAALPRSHDRARAHVIPNGVDLERFQPGDRITARHRLALPLDEILILFPHTPGVLRKRRDLAEAGIRLLGARGVGARLLDVHGVPHGKMPDYYRAADCLLLTSDQEGSPNVVKEALCCDLPVISVDVGDAPKWVALTPGSRIVSRDPPSIAGGLQAVLSGPRRVDGTHVRSEVSAERVALRLREVYDEARQRRRS